MNRYFISLTLFITIIFSSHFATANERDYYNKYNGFGTLIHTFHGDADFNESGNLLISSRKGSDALSLLSLRNDIDNGNLVYAMRIRNTDGKNDNALGIILNYADSLNYTELRFINGNSDKFEPHDRRFTIIEVWDTKNGKSVCTAKSEKIFKNIGHDNEFKTIRLNFICGDLIVQAGRSSFETVFQMPFSLDVTKKIGISSRGKVELKNLYIDYKPLSIPEKNPIYSEREIEEMLSGSTDPLVGVWNYFDRKVNSPKVQLGGKYSIAVLPDYVSKVYIIVYISDAKVNESKWVKGMIKGRLYPTSIYGNYNLVWYDADMNEMSDDCYASFSGSDLLELVFPIEKSSFRLIKAK